MKKGFGKLLDAFLESHSVKIKLVGTRTCLSLPKLILKGQYSNSDKCSNETLAINANKELIRFKNSIIEEFDALKLSVVCFSKFIEEQTFKFLC